MSADLTNDLPARKKAIREKAHADRNAQPDKDELSRSICLKVVESPAYRAARTVLVYVDVRSEVRTRHYLPDALGHGKKIVVPYCIAGELELFHLESMDELALGMYRILEPRAELRSSPAKRVDVRELDFVLVPGVAFTREGARMGHGFGYYDKLLGHARSDAPLVALAFECQLFADLPTASHDIFMDQVVTEKAVYPGRGRAGELR
jgi:5-formyltetrahydrofolate cyclo-ligase